VQEVIRDELPEIEQRKWVLMGVRALNKVFPEASYDQWPLCDRLLPHAKVAAEYAARFGLAYEDVGFLLNEAAAFMRLRADFEGSLRMHRQSLAIRERDLPAYHPAIAESLNDTACLFMDLYRYEEAEPLFRRAIEIARQVLSQDDSQYMLHLNNLGRLYVEIGRCKSATLLLEESLKIAEMASEEHLFMYAVVLNNVAELYLKLGQLSEAEDACIRSLRMREGIGNPEKLARSFVTLGEIKRRQRDPSAEDWFTRALDLKSEVHGADHPDLLPLLKRYARLLYAQERLQEALELERRAQQIQSRFDLPQYSEAPCRETGSL
jgi:tetratricopeptide (TPR) repeat protein